MKWGKNPEILPAVYPAFSLVAGICFYYTLPIILNLKNQHNHEKVNHCFGSIINLRFRIL